MITKVHKITFTNIYVRMKGTGEFLDNYRTPKEQASNRQFEVKLSGSST